MTDHPCLPQLSLPPADLLLRVDAQAQIGVGHALRLLGLAQYVRSQNKKVAVLGHIEQDWVRKIYVEADIDIHMNAAEPADLARQARSTGARAIIFDGYNIPSSAGAACAQAGLRVGALVDGGFGAQQQAHIYIDHNPGAVARVPRADDLPLSQAVAGAAYTLFRDDILQIRRLLSSPGANTESKDANAHPDTRSSNAHGTTKDSANAESASKPAPKILMVFGGTDPENAVATLLPALIATQKPWDCTLITPHPEIAADLPRHSQQELRILAPNAGLPALLKNADLLITASGFTVWETLCVGVPTAVVCVTANQQPGYDLVAGKYAHGLGILGKQTSETWRENLNHTLENYAQTTSLKWARDGQKLVDGLGRTRVAELLLG